MAYLKEFRLGMPKLVQGLCQNKITKLKVDNGVLKEGTPEEIVADERVRKVYLGEGFVLA